MPTYIYTYLHTYNNTHIHTYIYIYNTYIQNRYTISTYTCGMLKLSVSTDTLHVLLCMYKSRPARELIIKYLCMYIWYIHTCTYPMYNTYKNRAWITWSYVIKAPVIFWLPFCVGGKVTNSCALEGIFSFIENKWTNNGHWVVGISDLC